MAMAAVRCCRSLFLFILIIYAITPSLSVGDDMLLLDLKESLKNSSALDSTWIKGTNPCDPKKSWVGVECSGGNGNDNVVINLYLHNLGLSGDIDIDSLADLQGLRVISLENNHFSGPLPDFNRLTALKSLYLAGNEFSGEIPSYYFAKMGHLKKIELARNKFSGTIPDSLGQLNFLMTLKLEKNDFSGPIPEIAQNSLKEINLSHNKLQGEIPQTMSRFGAKPFEGNPDLCGSIVSKECKPQGEATTDESQASSGTKWVILTVVVAVLLVTILFKAKHKEDDSYILGKENLDEVVQVHKRRGGGGSNRRMLSSSRKGSSNSMHSSSRRGGSQHGNSVGDLVVINEEKGIFGLPDLMKAAAEVLGSGGLGSAYKAAMANGVSVVVKRLRDMNKLSKDAFDTEVRRLGRIRQQNILSPLAYHFRKEEKLLVSEYIPKGSLLFLLHGDRGIHHAELNWPTRLKIIKGVAHGMGFLHTEFASYELPHGNLKSSNILLSSNYEPLLMDYALYPLISNTQSVQALFAYKSPEAILYQKLTPKSDVYCLGIVILETITGKFPSQYLNNQKGGTDVVQWVRQAISEKRVSELIDPEIASASNTSLGQMGKLLHIGAACTESNYDKRIEMREAIKSIEEIQEV